MRRLGHVFGLVLGYASMTAALRLAGALPVPAEDDLDEYWHD